MKWPAGALCGTGPFQVPELPRNPQASGSYSSTLGAPVDPSGWSPELPIAPRHPICQTGARPARAGGATGRPRRQRYPNYL